MWLGFRAAARTLCATSSGYLPHQNACHVAPSVIHHARIHIALHSWFRSRLSAFVLHALCTPQHSSLHRHCLPVGMALDILAAR